MLALYLDIILDWLIAKLGKQVLDWSLRQVVEYFKQNPQEGKQCSAFAADKYVQEYDPDSDGFYWEKRSR